VINIRSVPCTKTCLVWIHISIANIFDLLICWYAISNSLFIYRLKTACPNRKQSIFVTCIQMFWYSSQWDKPRHNVPFWDVVHPTSETVIFQNIAVPSLRFVYLNTFQLWMLIYCLYSYLLFFIIYSKFKLSILCSVL